LKIVTPHPNQSIDDYITTKKCSNCGKVDNCEIIPAEAKEGK
jgi:hypothetical protein